MDIFYALPEEYYLDDLIEVDDLYVEATTDVEHNHVLSDGTIISIIGPYQHVMSVKSVLDQFPPSLSPFSATPATVPLTTPTQTSQPVGYTHGTQRRIVQDGVTFSGSGVMFFGASSSNPNNWYLVFFCVNNRSFAYECAACDRKFDMGEPKTNDYLFVNAIEACEKNSNYLFKIVQTTNDTARYVDIALPDQTIYRVYCYWIMMNDIMTLPTLFIHNRAAVTKHHTTFGNLTGAHIDLQLFDRNTLVSQLKRAGASPSFSALATDGNARLINGRTLSVLRALLNEGKLDSPPLQVKNVSSSLVPIQNSGDTLNVITVPT